MGVLCCCRIQLSARSGNRLYRDEISMRMRMQNNTKIGTFDEAWLNDWIKSLEPPVESKEQLDEKAKFLRDIYALDDTISTGSLDEVLIATKLEALAKYV